MDAPQKKSAHTEVRPPDDASGRRHPAHGVLPSDDTPTIVFLTVCTKNRAPWLASEAAHLHFFCAPFQEGVSLEKWMQFWKSRFSNTSPDPSWQWQSSHWDTRLRRDENYSSKWIYVQDNPIRAGLTPSSDKWPYQGEIHTLEW